MSNSQSVILSTIDVLYENIVDFSVRVALSTKNTYAPRGADDVYVEREVALPIATVEDVQSFKSVSDILEGDTYSGVEAEEKVIMYAHAPLVPLYKNPTVEFDSRIAEIPYGETVMMIEPQGRFFRVTWRMFEGWVLRDDIIDRAKDVYPEFIFHEENLEGHTNTLRVRAILNDIFSVGNSELPLQDGEYILYRLWKRGISVRWSDTRPRIPGLWHKILKGADNIHIGVVPRVGSVMEYILHDDIGHLAYVDAVFPDNTIGISEVNYPDSGIYNERTLTKEEWKELRPIFISAK